jgi:acetyltransferase-like isoleucine patch superfamily enzyme
MFIEPNHVRRPTPMIETKHTKNFEVQLVDPSRITKISQLDHTKTYRRNPGGTIVYYLSNICNHAIFAGRLDLLINNTDKSVELQTCVIEYMFTVKPHTSHSFHTDNFHSTLSLVTFITPATIPAESRFASPATIFVGSHKIHQHRMLCIKNDTPKWVTVKYFKVTEIDKFLVTPLMPMVADK